MSQLKDKEYKRFEDIKNVRPDGTEYWNARKLAIVLDYTKWENFNKVNIGNRNVKRRNNRRLS